MKMFLLIAVLLNISVSFSQQHVALRSIDHFGNNPGNLKMFIYADIEKKDTSLKPLVIVLHGCGQSVDEIAALTGWNKLASLNGFLVLYPHQKLLNNVSTCFNWFRNSDINKGQGESESIYQMIQYMRVNYRVDPNRIFITGLSAGAAMAVVMMATHPEMFNTGAIFAGGAYKLATNVFSSAGVMAGTKKLSRSELVTNVEEQNPQYTGKYPSVIIYQGLNDPVVNYKNAGLLIEQWTGIHHCDAVPDKTEPSYMNISDIKRMEFHDSSGNIVVTYYEINHLGHRILVKPGNAKNEGGETGIYGMNKNFHSTYQTAKQFGIISE